MRPLCWRATVRNDLEERSEASRVRDTHRFQTRHDTKTLKMSRGWHGAGTGTFSGICLRPQSVTCTTERVLAPRSPASQESHWKSLRSEKSVTAPLKSKACPTRFTCSPEGNRRIKRVGMRVPRVTTDDHGGNRHETARLATYS